MNAGPSRHLRAYRALLTAYPPEFRREYGPAMLQLFADQWRAAPAPRGRLTLWFRTLADTARAAASEWLNARRAGPSGARWARAAGLLFILGGVFIPLAWWLGSLRPSFDYHYRYHPFVQDVLVPAVFMAALTAFTAGAVCALAGLWPAANGHQRLALLVSALGGAASLLGWTALGLEWGEPWWAFAMVGLALFFLGVLWAGLAADARHPLPYAPAAWVFTGVWIPGMVLASTLYEMLTGRWLEGPDWVFGLALAFTSAGMLWVGGGLARAPMQPGFAPDAGDR